MDRMIETPTVGEILREEFMEPMNISAYRLAQDIMVPVSRIQDILHGRRKITADTSLRLSKYFGVSERYFLNLQNDIDIRNQRAQMADELARIQAVGFESIILAPGAIRVFFFFPSLPIISAI